MTETSGVPRRVILIGGRRAMYRAEYIARREKPYPSARHLYPVSGCRFLPTTQIRHEPVASDRGDLAMSANTSRPVSVSWAPPPVRPPFTAPPAAGTRVHRLHEKPRPPVAHSHHARSREIDPVRRQPREGPPCRDQSRLRVRQMRHEFSNVGVLTALVSWVFRWWLLRISWTPGDTPSTP